MRIRPAAVLALILMAACGAPPKPVQKAQVDPTTEPWYTETLAQLVAMNRDAEGLVAADKREEAAAVVQKARPLEDRLLAPARPTLAAMEAASDLDQLYGRMLLKDGRYGWARLEFQKNAIRWKIWLPHTPETDRRLKEARSAIEECDRRLSQ